MNNSTNTHCLFHSFALSSFPRKWRKARALPGDCGCRRDTQKGSTFDQAIARRRRPGGRILLDRHASRFPGDLAHGQEDLRLGHEPRLDLLRRRCGQHAIEHLQHHQDRRSSQGRTRFWRQHHAHLAFDGRHQRSHLHERLRLGSRHQHHRQHPDHAATGQEEQHAAGPGAAHPQLGEQKHQRQYPGQQQDHADHRQRSFGLPQELPETGRLGHRQ